MKPITDEKRFPLQGGPSVPWEAVAPHEAQAQRNHGQSLAELARRGGLSLGEFWFVMMDREFSLRADSWREAEVSGKALANDINLRYEHLNRDLLAARQEIAELKQHPFGHGEPCYYCGEPCDNFAGNPERWAVGLCHADDPGKVKRHHVGCVSSRLRELDGLRNELAALYKVNGENLKLSEAYCYEVAELKEQLAQEARADIEVNGMVGKLEADLAKSRQRESEVVELMRSAVIAWNGGSYYFDVVCWEMRVQNNAIYESDMPALKSGSDKKAMVKTGGLVGRSAEMLVKALTRIAIAVASYDKEKAEGKPEGVAQPEADGGTNS